MEYTYLDTLSFTDLKDDIRKDKVKAINWPERIKV